jgi:YkoP-like protein
MFFSSIGRAGVRAIDRILCWYYGVFEFTSDPTCIMRLSRGRSPRDVVSADGTRIQKGDALLVLHFRNEQIAEALGDVSLGWGLVFARGARQSLRLLAEFLPTRRAFDNVRAIYADFGFLQDDRMGQMRRLTTRLDFDFILRERPGWDVRRRAFWDNLFSWWLMWTYNPASLTGKSFAHMRRCELWMPRARLMARYQAIHEGTRRWGDG